LFDCELRLFACQQNLSRTKIRGLPRKHGPNNGYIPTGQNNSGGTSETPVALKTKEEKKRPNWEIVAQKKEFPRQLEAQWLRSLSCMGHCMVSLL
jgi:hypothetical protein